MIIHHMFVLRGDCFVVLTNGDIYRINTLGSQMPCHWIYELVTTL